MTALYLHRDGKTKGSALLARALWDVFGIPALPERAVLPGGKPWFPAYPNLHFNLSHSGPLVLCGVGDRPLGVDVEQIRSRSAGLPGYVLSDEEAHWFAVRGERWEDFYTLWTLKEARVKWDGTGLRRPPRTIAVPLLSPGDTGKRDGLFFRAYGGEDWRGAVCVSDPEEPCLQLRSC